MNNPVHWLYEQQRGRIPSGEAHCYLCGISCASQHAVAKGIADTFNSHYLAKCPSSLSLCAACAWYLDNKIGHPDFRKMSLIVAEKAWHHWQRSEMKAMIEQWLQHGLEADAYLVVSLSKKKHILLQAPLNVKGSRVLTLQVEENQATLDIHQWHAMDRPFMALLACGHGKGEIVSGGLYGSTLRKHGTIKEAIAYSQQLEPYRNSSALELLSYVTIYEREETHGLHANGTRDGSDPSRISLAQGRLESDRPRIQEQVQDGYLDAGRDQRRRRGTDDQHAPEISQQSLWEI